MNNVCSIVWNHRGVDSAAGTRTIPHAVSSAGGNSYTYDCNGSQIQRNVGGTQNLSYNAENKLVSVNGTVTANFVYDGDGKRVKSTINGSSVVYIGNDYEWTSSGVTQYYTTGSQRVGMRRSGYAANNGLFWLMGDHLGSTSITASANGSIYSEQRYTAWGSNRYTSGSLLSQRQYTGQINDGFGLYFYQSRWYDAALGRFAQADSIIPEPENSRTYDRYSYALNNPLRYNDPDGHNAWDVIAKFFTGFAYEFALTMPWATSPGADVLTVSSSESTAMLVGRVAGDVAAIVVGTEMTIGGAGGAALGVGSCGTGVLCAAGVGVVAVSAAAAGVGIVTAANGAGNITQNLSRLITRDGTGGVSIDFSTQKLQHEFKHAADFGVSGNWNKSTYSSFKQAILDHINGKNTQSIKGTYRNTMKVMHYYDPSTNLWVAVDENNNFVAGWKLTEEQVEYLLVTGNIQ